jgi:SOUL heme-binding protein
MLNTVIAACVLAVQPAATQPAGAQTAAAKPAVPEIRYLAHADVEPAVRALREALAADVNTDRLRQSMRSTATLLTERPFAAERAKTHADDAQADTEALRREAERLLSDLTFVPTEEAPTPRGWPPFTPPGEIELKAYPLYRLAEVANDTKLPEGIAFMTLFGHIQRNKIAMTAPVEMEMNDPTAVGAPKTMAFLYENTELGRLGVEGKVTVRDVPPRLAVTVGLRGEMDPTANADAAARIEQWLNDNAAQYTADGPIRVLGYNAPSLKPSAKYYEVQQVVKSAEQKPAAE